MLLICDGVSHVQSRSALLDIFQAVFVLGAFACLIADRDQVRARLAAAVADGSIATHRAGIALGARWWRFGAGVLLGLCTAVKWSGRVLDHCVRRADRHLGHHGAPAKRAFGARSGR